MKIKQITFTGADDNTDVNILREISNDFDWVEWGILLSSSSMKNTRFPSLAWMENLSRLKAVEPYVAISGHLCGSWLRELVKGIDNFSSVLPMDMFERIQLNFHGGKVHPVPEFYHILEKLRKKIIFQIDGANTDIYKEAVNRGVDAYPFFDLSHGAGVLPTTWDLPLDDKYCGYAGGLGPDNLAEQLDILHHSVVLGDRQIWIDMETKVRSTINHMGVHADVFDLSKVKTCIQIAKKYAC